jgi:hypothetical protein
LLWSETEAVYGFLGACGGDVVGDGSVNNFMVVDEAKAEGGEGEI